MTWHHDKGDMPPNFEMAQIDKPEQIVLATQRSLVDAMRLAVNDLKADKEKLGKQPGLTWEQIEYFLMSFREKTPHIFVQEQDQ